MCGIAGYIGEGTHELLAAMLHALKHRGPDDAGTHEEHGAGLGAVRLAIIDLTGGRQPIANEDGTLSIVFNGEVYNHRELRPRLEARGHRFRSRSDTEVILHLYEDEGERCVDQLRGMFAFAIWDARRRSLFLARDRMGKKPLYYWQRSGLFLFGSEIKALLCHPAVSRAVDWQAFHHYLAFGYTPAGRSIFSEIAKLPPAHTALLSGGRFTLRRYWSLPEHDSSPEPAMSARDAAGRVRQLLREAVRLRLDSDVPLGVFLSGGIDSSAIVASMREVTSRRISTFSVGFGQAAPRYDERRYARMVAARFETDHHEEIVEPNAAELLPVIVNHFDEPFADSSAIPTFAVAEATARHVRVALTGIGGDETFAGYPRYLGMRLSERCGRVARWLRAIPDGLISLVEHCEIRPDWGDRMRRFAETGDRPLPSRYIAWTRFFSDRDLTRMATPGLQAHWTDQVEAAHHAAFAVHGHGDALDGAFRIDLATYLPEDLLVMGDRMSMAHSLELRAPFCDHRLIEESLRIAPALKLPGFRLKGLLKAAFADALPPEILGRGKQGFMVPLARWLRTDLRDLMEELLSPACVRARGLWRADAVEILKQEHLSGRRSHGDRLWTLMVAELWARQYLDQRAPWRLN
jgi:asparagine synthase (glutamine-hydrolysing)